MDPGLSAAKRLFFTEEAYNDICIKQYMVIDEKLINYLEDLSFITLSAEDRGRICADLENIIAGMELLSTLDTSSAPGETFSLNVKPALRRDELRSSFSRREILKNAPHANEETFIVPRAVE